MIAVLQRAESAEVTVGGETVGKIGKGLLLLLGVAEGDGEKDAIALAAKAAKCRIFSDGEGKQNLSLIDVGGEALVVSNFTLLANYKHGNRPDYFGAAKPEEADRLYGFFVSELKKHVPSVQTGVFGADMKIALHADGPITIVMDSAVLSSAKENRTI